MKHGITRISFWVGACLLLGTHAGQANNVQVVNIGLWNLNDIAKTVFVEFDLSWENSWRTAVNRDAIWVFIKYKPQGSNEWYHATISTNGGDHQAAPGSVINPPADGKGAFICRSSAGTGHVNYASTKLRWDFGADGQSFQVGDQVQISVHAVEMVYIPEGAFYLGSGGGESGHFYQYTDGSQAVSPYPVISEAAITTGTGAGNLWGTAGTSGNSAVAPADGTVISNAFPKGFAAFYCMKYEISQGQYADFLNKLTATQNGTRFPNYSGTYRHTITGSITNRTTTTPDRACNYLSWMDGCAYADWAGLRPLTELEFEKACRGGEAPVANELAWGSASIHNSVYTLSNNGAANEVVSNPGSGTGNASHSGTDGAIDGPLRCGIFAASTMDPTRAEAGATYYGVMDLSGNLWERFVTVGNAAGRVFQGMHGDGRLSALGHATNSDWPGWTSGSGGQVTGATGAGSRGGYWIATYAYARVSDRFSAAETFTLRNPNGGWRGGRTAPSE